MPTYEYECIECHHHFDAVQKMADPPLTECPECGKSVHRVLSGGLGIIFQGSGFYVNDSHEQQKSEGMPSGEKSESAKPEGNKADKPPREKADKSEKPSSNIPTGNVPTGEKPKEKDSAVA